MSRAVNRELEKYTSLTIAHAFDLKLRIPKIPRAIRIHIGRKHNSLSLLDSAYIYAAITKWAPGVAGFSPDSIAYVGAGARYRRRLGSSAPPPHMLKMSSLDRVPNPPLEGLVLPPPPGGAAPRAMPPPRARPVALGVALLPPPALAVGVLAAPAKEKASKAAPAAAAAMGRGAGAGGAAEKISAGTELETEEDTEAEGLGWPLPPPPPPPADEEDDAGALSENKPSTSAECECEWDAAAAAAAGAGAGAGGEDAVRWGAAAGAAALVAAAEAAVVGEGRAAGAAGMLALPPASLKLTLLTLSVTLPPMDGSASSPSFISIHTADIIVSAQKIKAVGAFSPHNKMKMYLKSQTVLTVRLAVSLLGPKEIDTRQREGLQTTTFNPVSVSCCPNATDCIDRRGCFRRVCQPCPL